MTGKKYNITTYETCDTSLVSYNFDTLQQMEEADEIKNLQ